MKTMKEIKKEIRASEKKMKNSKPEDTIGVCSGVKLRKQVKATEARSS